jgi:hypothetical protein
VLEIQPIAYQVRAAGRRGARHELQSVVVRSSVLLTKSVLELLPIPDDGVIRLLKSCDFALNLLLLEMI